jgi:2-C-methyl-D-erythritol 4-phosphate cytidylyltransferase
LNGTGNIMFDDDNVAAIIVGAGQGLRMGKTKKKQYMLLGGLPMLSRTLCAFDRCRAVQEIFLVIPEEDRHFCRHAVLGSIQIYKPVHLVKGGVSRQESVLNGLESTKGKFRFVVIHDGVRPLVKPEKISECIGMAKKHGACILAMPTTDTVKAIDVKNNTIMSTLKRSKLQMAQTPQAFHYTDILEAHRFAKGNNYIGTDDAELLEKTGGKVVVIPGDIFNMKITTAKDLKMARALVSKESSYKIPGIGNQKPSHYDD